MAAVGGLLLAGIIIGWAVFAVLGGAGRTARRGAATALATDRPEWRPGIWHCAACLSTNPPTAVRCSTCRAPRQELVHAPQEPRSDWIPERIVVPAGDLVTLVHDPVAHGDPGEAHWRVVVGGRTAGSAARRDGALALLQALDGAETIALDVRGTGPSTYRVVDVIARFEASRFPLDVPCPERGS